MMDMQPARLQLKLLGRFELADSAARPIDIPGRKLQALVALLALGPSGGLTRDRLTGLLWGGSTEEKARANLRQSKAELRRLMGEHQVISGDRMTLALDRRLVDIDVVQFERLAREGDVASAVRLWRGQLLDGMVVDEPDFEAWLATERSRLSTLAVSVLTRALAREGVDDTWFECAQQLLKLEPAHEETHRALMLRYAERGDRAQVMRQYQSCRDVLSSEYGISPEAETEDLYRRLVHTARAREPLSGMRSLAVLPLANFSGDPNLDYFADGMTETLIATLARSADFFVVARTSSDAYKGCKADIREIGRALEANFIVEGSVNRSDKFLRVTAQLIDAETGRHVWSERFDRTASDPLALQDEIAQQIVATLAGEAGLIKKREYEQAWGRDTATLAEYDFYLRGHQAFMRFDREGTEAARLIWSEGLEKYPCSGLLKIKLAWAHAHRYLLGFSDNIAADQTAAWKLVHEGLAAPTVPPIGKAVGHWLLSILAIDVKQDFDMAMRERELTLALHGNSWHTKGAIALIAVQSGFPDIAIASLAGMPPNSEMSWMGFTSLGFAHFAKAEYTRAIEALKQASYADPATTLAILAASYHQLGQSAAAKTTIHRMKTENSTLTEEAIRVALRTRDPQVLERLMQSLQAEGW